MRNRKLKKNSKKFEKIKNEIVACFQTKTGWKRPTKRENKNYRSVPTRHVIENSKKMAKKFKKFKNTIMASFQSNIGLERPRKRENRYYHSLPFQHDL